MDLIEVEVAFQFVDAFEENILGFCNNIFTQEGGTHLAGFKTKFTSSDQFLRQGARDPKREGYEFYRSGYQKRHDGGGGGQASRIPIFEGQTKTKAGQRRRGEGGILP